MRRLDSNDDLMNGVVTYEFGDGHRICLDERAVREYGAETIIRDMGYGYFLETKRLPVMQNGKQVGTLPPNFDALMVRSRSPFYDVRPGDFIRQGDVWTASKMLGRGDLEAVPGFVWDKSSSSRA
jgi:hypothetical protein